MRNRPHLSATVQQNSLSQQTSQKEFFLLKELILKSQNCIQKKDLKNAVWGHTNITDKTLDINICRLRRKLLNSDVMISNIYSYGYQLNSTSCENF